jgi:hypothetical protein
MSSAYNDGSSYDGSEGYGRAYGGSSHGSDGYYGRPSQIYGPTGYPPINLPPVKPYPPDPYIDQFPLPEAICAGTLFRWLYDPYENPYGE